MPLIEHVYTTREHEHLDTVHTSLLGALITLKYSIEPPTAY